MQGQSMNLFRTQSQQITIPSCKRQQSVKQLCHNPNCKSSIYLCAEQSCQCQVQHQFCLKVNLKALLKVISQKREKPNNDLTNYIEKLTDRMIDQISSLRDDLISRLQYLGLNQKEREFLSSMQKKQYQKITSQDIHNICTNFHIKDTICLDYSIDSIERFWKRQNKNFDNLLQSLSKTVIKSFKSFPRLIELDSKIIGEKQNQILTEMFEEKIVSANLLYRGSEHNFSIPQFRKLCDKKKNNICLVKTEHGNIIGAYTPIAWDTNLNSQYANDPTLKTFIFSLTLNKKFVQTNPTNTTHHYTSWGPRYGNDGTCDFAIGDNGNNGSTKCYANICSSFMPQKQEDQKNLDFLKQNFVGGGIKGTNKFKITQWQMFEIEFD